MTKNRIDYLLWLKEEEELDRIQEEEGYVDRLMYFMTKKEEDCLWDYSCEFSVIEEAVIAYLIETARCYPDIVKPLIRRVLRHERAQEPTKKSRALYAESVKVE